MQFKKALILLALLPTTALADTIVRQDYTHDTEKVVTTVRMPEYVITSNPSHLNSLTVERQPVLLSARFGGSRVKDTSSPLVTAMTPPAGLLPVEIPPSTLPPGDIYDTPPSCFEPLAPFIAPLVLLFNFDEDVLHQDDLTRLAALPVDQAVTVTGYSCSLGTDEYNQDLSSRRAAAVAKELSGRGVLVKQVEGKGDCCPINSEQKELNRRVEITPIAKD